MIEYMTPKEVSARLKVSEQTVRNMFSAGMLKGLRIGKLIRIEPDSLGTVPEKPSRRKVKVKDYFAGIK